MFSYLLLVILLNIFSLDAKAQDKDEFFLKHIDIYFTDTKKIWGDYPDLRDKVEKLQKIQGYTYSNPHIAALAMIRPPKAPNLAKYIQKLEFLGALYLKIIVSELYIRHSAP